jgi:hypothetical protein
MNGLTGLALKLAGDSAAGLLTVVSWGFGLVLASSLLALLRVFGVGRRASFATALVFALVPPTLYLEHLHGDAVPSGALLTLGAVLLHRAVLRQTTLAWMAFFTTTMLLALLRGTFHLSWLAALLGLALREPARRPRAGVCGLGPTLLVVAVHLKNLAHFSGVASQRLLYHVTVRRMPVAGERRGWRTAVFVLDLYGSPRQYQPHFVAFRLAAADTRGLREALDGQPNFNHRSARREPAHRAMRSRT